MPINEKTRHRRVLRKPSVWGYLGLLVTASSGKQLPKHPFSLAASSRIVQAKSRQNPVTARVVWVVGPSDDSAQHVIASYWGNRRELAPDE